MAEFRRGLDNQRDFIVDHASLGGHIKTVWSGLRFRAVALSAGCGCSGGFPGLTARDFEEALVFHVRERRRHDQAFAALASMERLDDIIDWAASSDDPPSADRRFELLQEVERSIKSFSSTCAVHRFSAEAV
jgi:hypothetical protein